ncbi:MAG: helix-turn-helix domain-containing protein [Polyangiaceae bacterium]
MRRAQVFDWIALGRRLWAARKDHERREHRDVTGEEFAELVSKCRGQTVQGPQVSDYERGKHAPKLDTILAWAKVSEVDPGWLAFGDDAVGRRLEVQTPRAPMPVGKRATTPAAKRGRAG